MHWCNEYLELLESGLNVPEGLANRAPLQTSTSGGHIGKWNKMGNHDSLHRHTIIYLSLQEIAFEEVVGGPQSSLSFDLLMEIRTGNCCDLSSSI